MSYLDLINRYWQEVEIKGWTPVETNIYFRLLDICNKSGWKNPFALPNPRAVALMAVTENTLAAGRDRLVMKGLIGFKKGSRRSEVPVYCFPEKINGEWIFPESFTSNIETKQGVKPMTKPTALEKNKIKTKNILDDNNKILLTRTREEADLDRFDSLLQQIAVGREQIWVDQMMKKHGIDNISDYLPSFRDHVIANSKLHEVSDINGFKRYFNVAFRYFSRINPVELLGRYEN